MLIGPHIDLNEPMSNVSENSIAAAEQFLGEALNNTTCTTLECYGTKTALSVGLVQLSGQAQGTNEATPQQGRKIIPMGITPFPKPRLVRKG